MKHWIFLFGLGTLFTHELDAVANYEWRVLPLVRLLPEELGMLFFIAAHVPIFAVIIALVTSPRPKVRFRTRIAVSIFLIVHGVLHVSFMSHPAYEFSSTMSNILIYGGSIFGITHLLFEILDKNSVAT